MSRRLAPVVVLAILLAASALSGSAQTVISTSGDLPVRENLAPPKGTGLVLGRTVDADSGKPIAGVTVSLYRLGTTGYEPVITDDQGRFVFRDLGAGTLTLRANKPGYMDGAFAKLLPTDQSDAGQPLDLGDDERLGDVTVKLWKYAAVGGTVVDERGEPMVNAIVRALPRKIIGGRPQFSLERVAGSTARTDDRGVFRLSTLVPGDYVFVVPVIVATSTRAMLRPNTTPNNQRPTNYSDSSGSLNTWLAGSGGGGGSASQFGDDRFVIVDSSSRPSGIGNAPSIAGLAPDGTLLSYETTFHPASSSLARASVVTLRSGEEREGVDFHMRPVPSMRVSGTLVGPDGPAGDFLLRLVQAEVSTLTSSDPEVAQTVSEADGRFTFLGVAPGQYNVRVLKMPRPASSLSLSDANSIRTAGGGVGNLTIVDSGTRTLPNLPTLWADTPVTVGGRNVDDAVVTLQAGFRISGRIAFDDGPDKPPATSTQSVYVERADGSVSSNFSLALGRADAQGNFSTYGQRPGKYYVRMPYAPAGWYLRGAMFEGRDISAVPVDLSRDVEGVVLRFSPKPSTELSGLVTNAQGQPEPSALVVAFTTDQQLWGNSGQTPRSIRAVGTGKGGRYTLANLPPGDYFVAAVTPAVADWADPKRLTAWSRTAPHVTLADGDRKSQDVRVTATLARRPQPGSDPDQYPDPNPDPPPAGHGPFTLEPVDDQTPPPAQVRDVAPLASGTCVISGVMVSDDAAAQPMRRVSVTLTGTAAFGTRVMITDDTGRFAFTNLPAGRYGLSASKPAYLAANYGASATGRAGTTISLADGQQMKEITLRLPKGSVITGIIRDVAGQPLQGATVQAMKYSTVNGERQLRAVNVIGLGTETTDDRGQYRIYGLTPGDYVVGAAFRFNAGSARQMTDADIRAATDALKRTPGTTPGAGPSGKAVSYAPVFFPGTTVAADASMVTVAKGEEKRGVDFAMQRVPTARVEGVVTNPGGPLPANLDLRMVAVSRVGPTPIDIGAILPVRPQADGKFSYPGIAPGQYAIVALSAAPAAGRGAPAAGAPAQSLWATANVSVNGVDVTGLTLALQPGMTVSGKVVLDATTLAPPADLAGIRVTLQPVLTGSQVSAGTLSAIAAADGSFALRGIMPGRYKMSSLFPTGVTSVGWQVRSAMVGGRDATDVPFEIAGGQDVSDVVVTYTDRPSEVSGLLQDATGRPATDYFIILFPSDRALWGAGPRRIQQVRPASDGKFAIRSLKAGSYLIAAVTDAEPGESSDPAFLEQLIAGAVKIDLAEGDKKVQDIKIAK